jgi:hypothetical protein
LSSGLIFYNDHQTHWGGKANSNKELNAEIKVYKRLADPPEENWLYLIFDNLGWYCNVINIFIRQQQIQKVP